MEEPLPAGGSCLLGALNLSSYVKNREFDYREFRNDIYNAIKGLNEVLDEGLGLHPLQIQRDTVRDYRQIGLGVMGIADMLIKMGLKYDSEKALGFCDNIAFILANTSLKANALLAKVYGTYPKYNREAVLTSDFVIRNTSIDTYEDIERYGLRNSQILTIAPTGSISTMLGISGGIEPIYDFSYTRKTESLHSEGDIYYKVYTPIVKEYMELNGLHEEDELPNYFVNAKTIDPFKRVEMQGVWQKHIDASISSTVNLPNEATIEDVESLYMSAWENRLKGMTIYRDGCSRSGVLSTETKEDVKEEVETEENKLDCSYVENKPLGRGEWKSLADDTYYVKKNLTIGCGKLKLFIGYSPSEHTIQDLYIVKSGNGGCEKNLQAIAISMSALLRVGGNVDQLEKAFSGIGTCPSFAMSRAKGEQLSKGNYCGIAIINEVKAFMKEMDDTTIETEIQHHGLNKNNTEGLNDSFNHYEVKNGLLESTQINCSGNCSSCKNKCDNHDKVKCPSCGEYTLSKTGGCEICTSCGFSKCE